MSETIVAALISAIAAIVVCVITMQTNHKKLLTELEKRDELQMYRLEQLEKKVELHNNVVERTYKLEKEVARMQDEEIRQNHRLEILEEH